MSRTRFKTWLPNGSSVLVWCEHMFAMPWIPSYAEEEARAALSGAESWREALLALGCAPHGKNIRTLRRWAERWGIPIDHLPDRRGYRPRYSNDELRSAVASSFSWSETLRKLGYCPSGANWRTLQRRTAELAISTDHFDPTAASRAASQRGRIPLEEILVEGSTYSRSKLKNRLYAEGLKERRCELCGQDEIWRGKRMGLILDHINGVRDDNRLENLRVVCPNCAATLDTHCGRKNRLELEPRVCLRCKEAFVPRDRRQRYCSRYCGSRWDRTGVKRRGVRKVPDRPSRERLLAEVQADGYLATGRRYGVSDNAVRKWLREYERERLVAAGGDPEAAEIPRRTWPNRRRDIAA